MKYKQVNLKIALKVKKIETLKIDILNYHCNICYPVFLSLTCSLSDIFIFMSGNIDPEIYRRDMGNLQMRSKV